MKVTFLGGGALRLLGTANALMESTNEDLDLHLSFMDLDLGRAETVAKLTEKMPSAEGRRVTTEATDDLECALDGADSVYLCIRVGGVEALERDKRIAARHGFHGHDDFGPSAVMLTARTLPVTLRIAEQMAGLCPQAWLIVHTNPITTLVDGLTRYSEIKSVGVCSGVYNFAWDMDHLFSIGVPNPDLEYQVAGLNHLSWVLPDATHQGKLITEMVREQWDDLPQREGAQRCDWPHSSQLFELYGQMHSIGHGCHFWFHYSLARRLDEHFNETQPDEMRSSSQHRAAVQAAELAKQDHIDSFWEQPFLVNCRTPPFGDIGVQAMLALLSDEPRELAVTYPNRGHVVGLIEEAPVEAHMLISKQGPEPLHLDGVPAAVKGLYNSIAEHQRLVVDAAVRADYNALLQALVAEPTIRSYDRARPMFDELWSAAVAAGEIKPAKY